MRPCNSVVNQIPSNTYWRVQLVCMIVQAHIFTTIATWNRSQDKLPAPETSCLKISSHETSLEWSQRPSQSAEKSHKLCDEKDHPFWVWRKVNGNWDMIRISRWKEYRHRTDTCIRRNKSKRARLRATVWDPSRKVDHLSKVIWDRKITKFRQNRLSSPCDGR